MLERIGKGSSSAKSSSGGEGKGSKRESALVEERERQEHKGKGSGGGSWRLVVAAGCSSDEESSDSWAGQTLPPHDVSSRASWARAKERAMEARVTGKCCGCRRRVRLDALSDCDFCPHAVCENCIRSTSIRCYVDSWFCPHCHHYCTPCDPN
jgi:hypothetical protein